MPRRGGRVHIRDDGRPAEAERSADVVDRWQYQDAARPEDPAAEAWAAVLRANLRRRGVEQMRADADEAVRRCAEEGIPASAAGLLQGIARILCGDLDAGDASLEDAVSACEEAGVHRESRGRAVRTVAGGDGAQPVGPGRGPGRASTRRVACGRDRGHLRHAPGLRGAGPGSPAPGRCPGGTPGTGQLLSGCGFCRPARSPMRPFRSGSSSPACISRWPTWPGPGR